MACDISEEATIECSISAGVSTLSISNYSNFLLAGRDDGIISFHSLDLAEAARVRAHADIIAATTAHTSAPQCASVGWDGRLVLWDWSANSNPMIDSVSMQCQYRDVKYNEYSNCTSLCTVGSDGFLRIWDPRCLDEGCSTMFNLQQMGSCCTWASEHNLIVGLESGDVLGYDVRKQCLWQQRTNNMTVRKIVVQGDQIATGGEDGAVCTWKHGQEHEMKKNVAHKDYITDMLWCNGAILTSSVDKSVVLNSFL